MPTILMDSFVLTAIIALFSSILFQLQLANCHGDLKGAHEHFGPRNVRFMEDVGLMVLSKDRYFNALFKQMMNKLRKKKQLGNAELLVGGCNDLASHVPLVVKYLIKNNRAGELRKTMAQIMKPNNRQFQAIADLTWECTNEDFIRYADDKVQKMFNSRRMMKIIRATKKRCKIAQLKALKMEMHHDALMQLIVDAETLDKKKGKAKQKAKKNMKQLCRNF